MVKQLNINFNPTVYDQYGNLRSFLDEHLIPEICKGSREQRQLIAANLELSPSHMKNKLVASDGAKFNTDELELFITKYGTEPIKYLVSKYMYQSTEDEISVLKARLKELEGEG